MSAWSHPAFRAPADSLDRMPISPAHVGREYPPTPPYEVSAAKIAEFATAVGETGSDYFGTTPIAPLTFAAVITTVAWEQLFADPALEFALRRIVHADQRFDFSRPMRAGDTVAATLRIESVRNRGANDIVSASVRIATTDGEPVCTAAATFLHSHDLNSVEDTA